MIFMMKSRVDYIQGMLAIIQSKIFCLPVSYKKRIKMYKTVILPVVPYGCETWSVTLREEHRLRIFEIRAPRKISGSEREGGRRIMERTA
jgi:hypothetical protein